MMSRPLASESVFRAIADPARRRILDILRRGDQPAGEIAKSFRFSRPSLSFHLGILMQAGLISQTRRGSQRIYHLQPRSLKQVVDWLRQYEQPARASSRPTAAPIEA